jgi:hypothetical protein
VVDIGGSPLSMIFTRKTRMLAVPRVLIGSLNHHRVPASGRRPLAMEEPPRKQRSNN